MVIIWFNNASFAQNIDSTIILDSIKQDTILRPVINISPDAIEDEVKASARDSVINDLENKKILLYGAAQVNYTTIELKADYIELSSDSSEVFATHTLDTAGQPVGIPEFSDGDQNFFAKRIRYNFQTKKGIIYDISTEQADLFVLGAKAKFISGEEPIDSLSERHDVIYSKNAIFTSCNHPEPHFGIRSTKQKMIPGKEVVIGPSNLELMGIPTPLFLPFGFFPVTTTSRHGLVIPRDYEYSPELGYGIRELGYFIPFNDHINAKITGDLYFNGSWGAHLISNFNKKYKYRGALRIDYSNRIAGNGLSSQTSTKPFALSLNWSQDPKAHPHNSLSANVRYSTQNYQRVVENDARSQTTSAYNSSISFRRKFPNIPFTLSATANLSQNLTDGTLSLNLPNINVQMNKELQPFKKKVRVGKEAWYESFGVTYNSQFKNSMTATDSTLFKPEMFRDAKYGAEHKVTAKLPIKVFKYFTISPNISYTEQWHFQELNREWEYDRFVSRDTIYNADSSNFTIQPNTITNDSLIEDISQKLRASREYRAGVSISPAQLYGIVNFKKGPIRGIRHMVSSNFSFGYAPDYTKSDLDYFRELEFIDTDGESEFSTYSVFRDNAFKGPSSNEGSLRGSYSFSNNIEIKVWNKKKQEFKKIPIIEQFSIGGSYNFQADSLHFEDISMSGNTNLIKGGISRLNYRFTFTPYAKEYSETKSTKINRFQLAEKGKLLNFQTAQFTLNSRMPIKKVKELLEGKNEDGDKKRDLTGSIIDLIETFTISHNMNYTIRRENDGTDTAFISRNIINLRGSLELTDNWNIAIGNIGYDFIQKRITYPDLGFFRKLHCWEMGMNWQPTRGTYSFYIRVSPSSPLGFIDLPWDLNNSDAARFRF